MRIKDGFVMREVAGQTMVIATGEASRNFHGMIKLNSTGKMIWEGLMQGLSRQEITERITETCDAEPGQVKMWELFWKKWKKPDFLHNEA